MTVELQTRDKKMKAIVGRIHNLPTPPIVFTQISNLMNNPDASAYDIANIISEDPALTAKILKLTNSSFYGIPRTITSVKQAVVILGMEAVKSLVISASVFDMFSKKYKLDGNFLDQFWRHSLASAFMGKIISRMGGFPSIHEAEVAFSSGLLHDIGKMILSTHLPQEQTAISELLKANTDMSIFEAENQVLEFNHADIGGMLCAKWNLPEAICNAIRDHHDPATIASNSHVALIHLSSYLSYRMNLDDEPPPNLTPLVDEVWACLALSRQQESGLIEMLKADYSKAEVFLNIAKGLE